MIKKLLLPLILIFSSNVLAKEIWKADMSVDKVTQNVKDLTHTCSIDVSNNGDDDARDVKVIILLPMNVKFINANIKNLSLETYKNDINKTKRVEKDAMKSSCSPNKSKNTYSSETAYIECSLGNLSTLADISIEIKSKFIDSSRKLDGTCSASVYNSSPDGKLSNNYRLSE